MAGPSRQSRRKRQAEPVVEASAASDAAAPAAPAAQAATDVVEVDDAEVVLVEDSSERVSTSQDEALVPTENSKQGGVLAAADSSSSMSEISTPSSKVSAWFDVCHAIDAQSGAAPSKGCACVCVQLADEASEELFAQSLGDSAKIQELQDVMMQLEALKEEMDASDASDEAAEKAMQLKMRELVP